MLDFEYYSPTRLIVGRGKEAEAGHWAAFYGAKKVLLPITSAVDLGTVPSELIGHFNIIFYQSAEDAVFKALGVE